MSAILLSYLAMSYTFSGFVCYLAALKHFPKKFQLAGFSKHPALLGNLAVTILWPIWLLREIERDSNWHGKCTITWANEIAFPPPVGYSQGGSPLETRVRIEIPKIYQQDPVLSRLTSEYGVTFTITKALLNVKNQENGLFDLELSGTPQQIQKALEYLLQKEVKFLEKASHDGDNW